MLALPEAADAGQLAIVGVDWYDHCDPLLLLPLELVAPLDATVDESSSCGKWLFGFTGAGGTGGGGGGGTGTASSSAHSQGTSGFAMMISKLTGIS